MKIFNVLVIFLGFFILSSCQKELNFEDLGGTAVGGLKYDDSHDCYPSTVNGQYVVDTALTANNFIDVQVNIITPGTYSIHSDTTHGYFFSGTGDLGTVGLNTVRLYGTGTPTTAGVDQFIIRFDTSSCIVDVTVLATTVTAQYTFAGAGGTCTGAVPHGIYMQNFPMSSSDSVTISVDVTSIGNYNISTTTTNGITFTATGAFTTTGQQVVELLATGTPAASGPSTFPLVGNGGGSGCAFTINFDPPAPAAVFTLGGNPGSCTGVILAGTYQATTTVTGANTATIDVNVTTAGTYAISTNTINGMVFSASGLFTTTGPQPVVLNAGGTPSTAGSFDFIVTGGSSTCTFTVPVDPAPGVLSCSIDGGPVTNFNVGAAASLDNTSTPTSLDISGSVSSTSNDFLEITVIGITGTPIAVGTYDVNMDATTTFVGADYVDAVGVDWQAATDGTTQTPAFTITITNITTGSNPRVTGTFSGPVKDGGGSGPNVKMLSNGTFDLPLQ